MEVINMETRIRKHLDVFLERYSDLRECEQSIIDAYNLLEECFSSGKKLLIAGNGGSCADSEHIVGELMKGFILPRECNNEFKNKLLAIDKERGEELGNKLQGGLPAIALADHASLNTAYINDVKNGGDYIYAQQLYGYGKCGDVFLGISTSGNSKNIMNATVVARALGVRIISLTGRSGGLLANVSDVAIKVPADKTHIIQELHLPVYHCLCLMLEERFFGKE